MKIWYLYHSGFAVETKEHFLIFDYWRDTPKGSLEDGVVNPQDLGDRDVIVFSSHRHSDHYNEVILGWSAQIPKLRFVLSDDIPNSPGAIMIGPNQKLEQPDFTVETLASTDEGVAFLVDIDGARIYHAGDLNWWHWEGEHDDYNEAMARNYKEQINLLREKSINLAFVPVDPRLGEQYSWGMDYIMDTVTVERAIPMHFGDDPSVVGRLLESSAYRDRIIPLTARGQSAIYVPR